MQEGIVTFFGDEFGSQDSISVVSENETRDFIIRVDPTKNLLKSYDELKKILPLKFDRDSMQMRNSAYNNDNLCKWRHLIPELNNNDDIKINTYFEIPTET